MVLSEITEENTVMISAPRNALQNPVTSNPSKNEEANQKSNPLITSTESPNVTIVIGNVNNTKTGFTSALSNPSTSAAIIAAYHPEIEIPGTTSAIMRSTKALISQRTNTMIIHANNKDYGKSIRPFFSKIKPSLRSPKITFSTCSFGNSENFFCNNTTEVLFCARKISIICPRM